ncbi:MAG: nitroreductase family deazaflavin-dependent oxidoreductase [Actinobacteria bacterium]|nr:nitroreductase family deazaflavin-dependent oxidoreductase [Actinomycetota bacterium]
MSKFMRFMNRFPAVILHSPLHRLMSGSTLLITFTGRKSGKRYTTPVTYLREGDIFLMTTDSPWWRNLRGGAPLKLRVKGKEHAAFGEAVTDEAEVARVMEMMTRQFPRYGKYAGIETYPDGRLDPADLEKASRERMVVRARLDYPRMA